MTTPVTPNQASTAALIVKEHIDYLKRLGAEWTPYREALETLVRIASEQPLPVEQGEQERIDDGLVQRFRSALAFAASRSVISAADERALIAALTKPASQTLDRLRARVIILATELEELVEFIDGLQYGRDPLLYFNAKEVLDHPREILKTYREQPL